MIKIAEKKFDEKKKNWPKKNIRAEKNWAEKKLG